MKKTILIVIVILFVNFSLSWITSVFGYDLTSTLALKAASKLGLVFFTLYVIFKQEKTWPYNQNLALWGLVAIVLICLSFYQMDGILAETELKGKRFLNGLYLTLCLGTGFFEELLFRVYMFSGFYYLAFNKKAPGKRFYLSILWASIAFALAHFTNTFKAGYDIYGVVSQMVFAFFIGAAFQSMLIRFKSVILVGTLHGIVNYFGAYRGWLGLPRENSEVSFGEYIIDLSLLTLILALFIIPLCYALVQRQIKNSEHLSDAG